MKRFRSAEEEGEMDSISTVTTANVLMLLSRGSSGGGGSSSSDEGDREHTGQSAASRVFECKTCNRQFPSFQALGGHRASHKKPRLLQSGDNNSSNRHAKPRVHECSICGLEFAIGQALGGHMRRHRNPTESAGYRNINGDRSQVDDDQEKIMISSKRSRVLCLDLNLPPSENDGLGLGIGLNNMVF